MAAPTLESLRDIHLPSEPMLWPPAPGWWLVALFLLLLTGLWLLRRHLRRRPLRAALLELELLAKISEPVPFASGVSRLLRRYACWRYPDAGVAALTGAAWLQFLDQHGGAGQFQHGAGAVLDALPYRPDGTADQQALAMLVRDWLRRNAP